MTLLTSLAVGAVAGKPGSDTIFAVDAKLNFDDNAAFRQKDIYGMRDRSMEDARDVAAEEAGLNYIGLAEATALAEAMAARRQGGSFRLQKGYDHSYFFVSTFMEDHIAFHAGALHG